MAQVLVARKTHTHDGRRVLAGETLPDLPGPLATKLVKSGLAVVEMQAEQPAAPITRKRAARKGKGE